MKVPSISSWLLIFCCILIASCRCDEAETTEIIKPAERTPPNPTTSVETSEYLDIVTEETLTTDFKDLLLEPAGFSAEPSASNINQQRLAQFRLSPLNFLELNGLADDDNFVNESPVGRAGRGSSYVYEVPVIPFGSEDVGVRLDETGAETSPHKLLIRPDPELGYEYQRPSNPIQLPDKLTK